MVNGARNARAFGLALAVVVLAPAGAFTSAQQNDDWCRDDSWGRDREGVCEVRQFTVAATSGVLAVAGTNGGIRVEGQARNDVLILAKVVATAESQARAREIAGAIRINATLERVEAEGPRGLQNGQGWSVSYRLAVPRGLNLSLQTTNGGITIQEVDSQVEFKTTNGGVKLIAVGGDVRGRTSNGGVDVDLEGPSWNGEGLDVETSNGGVRLSIPEHYSAKLEASTHNGGMNIDYPGAPRGSRDRDISVQLGSGGAPIRVRTSNGGIRVTRK
jgi:hypothetical protein